MPIVVDIDATDEIGVWPSLPPVFTTMQTPLPLGVHIHRRKHGAIKKDLDAAFMHLQLQGQQNLNITNAAARDFTIANLLYRPLEESNCSHCGASHLDEDWFAVHAHKKHLCFNCGKEYSVTSKNIGNPLAKYQKLAQQRPSILAPRSINLETLDLKNGIALWATNPAIIWTTNKPEETGIHLHTYNTPTDKYGSEIIDDTYGKITLNNQPLDNRQIAVLMAQQNLPHLHDNLVSLHCPTCKEPHFDDGPLAYTPHIEHTCNYCQTTFKNPGQKKYTISNPSIHLLQQVQQAL